ncbi:Mis12-Mtw1 protein family-domain-containing protein [Syncephalis fuscata]|nr:Mis12-Mtw1 protein family-domain-containing protein [Syncephalis fuscata]
MGRPRDPAGVRVASLRSTAKRIRSFADIDDDFSQGEDNGFVFRTRRSQRNNTTNTNGIKVVGTTATKTATPAATPRSKSISDKSTTQTRLGNSSKPARSNRKRIQPAFPLSPSSLQSDPEEPESPVFRVGTRSTRKTAKENAAGSLQLAGNDTLHTNTPTQPKRRATKSPRKKTSYQTTDTVKDKSIEAKSDNGTSKNAEIIKQLPVSAAHKSSAQKRKLKSVTAQSKNNAVSLQNKAVLPSHPPTTTTPRKKQRIGNDDAHHRTPRRSQPDYTELFVQIPIAETPIANKNREMRKERRRSSFTMRGKRKSSFGGSLGLGALPHPDISTDNFYRHIEADKADVIRVRQLLLWCAHRATDQQTVDDTPLDTSALAIARKVQEKVIEKFYNGKIDTTYFRRDTSYDEEPTEVIKHQKHPENETNLVKKTKYEDTIKRY